MVATVLATPVLGQVPAEIRGRVVDANTGSGIENAIVALAGHGATLTSTDGLFFFDGVEPGEYTLRIEAFGYVSESLPLTVEGDRTVTIPLEIVPFMLDSLIVEPRAVDVDGHVRDGEKDLPVVDAEILTNRVPSTRTGVHGRFSLDDVWEGVPLLLSLRAFGYLPMDTILHPVDGHGPYDFGLAADPIAERMIELQIGRIVDRAGGRRAILMRPLERDRLLRRTGASLGDVLKSMYPRRHLQRVRCIFVDERLLSPRIDGDWVNSMSPGEVERVEFLYRGAIMRIYTRDFMKRMIAGEIELRHVTYVATPTGPFCT